MRSQIHDKCIILFLQENAYDGRQRERGRFFSIGKDYTLLCNFYIYV